MNYTYARSKFVTEVAKRLPVMRFKRFGAYLHLVGSDTARKMRFTGPGMTTLPLAQTGRDNRARRIRLNPGRRTVEQNRATR